MRPLKARGRQPYEGVEIEITDRPHVLYVYRPNGIVAFPRDVYRHFKSLKALVAWTEPYLERRNGSV